MRKNLFLVISALAATACRGAGVISSVSRIDGGDRDPAVLEMVNTNLRAGSRYYSNSDALFTYGTLPTYLLGADFVQTDIGDIQETDYQLQVSLAEGATVYLFIDDRVTNVAVSMPWLATLGFTDKGINNLTVGTNVPYSIYSAVFAAGDIILGANGSSTTGNMYTLAAMPVPEPCPWAMGAVISPLLLLRRKRKRGRGAGAGH